MEVAELAGMAVGFFLTVLILSYLILDDNPLFRMGAHLLVGVSSGYLLAVMVRAVLWDQYLAPLFANPAAEAPSFAVSLILLLLLMVRQILGGKAWGNIPMAFLAGAGAAVVVGGAITGTLLPQAAAAAAPSLLPISPDGGFFDLAAFVENIFVLAGTILSLAYFHFGAKPRGGAAPEQPAIVRPFARAGAAVVSVTLGALYAGALLSALVVLVDRMQFLVDVGLVVMSLIGAPS